MERILNIIFGICSLMGLAVSLATYNKGFQELKKIIQDTTLLDDIQTVYNFFIITILLLVGVFITQHFYQKRKLKKLEQICKNYPTEIFDLKNLINKHILISRHITSSIHGISKSEVDCLSYIQQCLEKNRNNSNICSEKEYEVGHKKFDNHINLILEETSSTLSAFTDDICATCIKLLSPNSIIKTFRRDSKSNRERYKGDLLANGKVFTFDIVDNYAFKIILLPKHHETHYFCDNLKESTSYYNSNPNWPSLYNAKAVVPICYDISTRKMHVLGFICCDNFKGGLAVREIEDYLFFISYQLYKLLKIYDEFYRKSKENNLPVDQWTNYGEW